MNFNTDFTYLIMYPIKTALIKGLLKISKDLGNAKLLSAVSLDNLIGLCWQFGCQNGT